MSLNVTELQVYWSRRYQQHGSLASGFANRNAGIQNEEYRERWELLSGYLDVTDAVTLEVGCGAGWYAGYFDVDFYTGIDQCEEAIRLAMARHPGYRFNVCDPLPCLAGQFDQVFFATVLQHCDDNTAKQLIERAKAVVKPGGNLILYENTDVMETPGAHMSFRSREDYGLLVGIDPIKAATHKVHGERHSVMVFKV